MKSIQSLFGSLVFTSMLAVSGSFLYGQTHEVAHSVNEEASSIKFAGIENEMLVFDVLLNDMPAKGVSLSIMDNEGTLFLEEKILRTTHSCRYKIQANSINGITFKITGKGFTQIQSFTISHKIEEKWEVKRAGTN